MSARLQQVNSASTVPHEVRAPQIAIAGEAKPASEMLVETRHARIALRQTDGPGLPLLFLHGNAAAKEIFAAQLESPLAQAYRLIAMDFPGHGGSSDASEPEESYSIPGYADAAIEVLETLGIDQVAVVGWSLGGHVAVEMMASFPGLVGAFLIGAPPLSHGPGALERAFHPAGLAALADVQAPWVTTACRHHADPQAGALLAGSLEAGVFEDARHLVETMDTPVAMVAGNDDPFIDTGYLRGITCANPWNGGCHLFPRAGHTPFLSAPTIFNTLLAAFARDMDGRARRLRDRPWLTYSG